MIGKKKYRSWEKGKMPLNTTRERHGRAHDPIWEKEKKKKS